MLAAMDEELQEVRDNFYVGNFTKALSLCESVKGSNELTQSELGATLARCCLSIPQVDRLKAMQNSEIPGQRAAALMAVITKSKNAQQVSSAKERLAALAKETQDLQPPGRDMSCAMLNAIVLAIDGAGGVRHLETTMTPSEPESSTSAARQCEVVVEPLVAKKLDLQRALGSNPHDPDALVPAAVETSRWIYGRWEGDQLQGEQPSSWLLTDPRAWRLTSSD
eukprot:Skav224659  [mRNA]  locus=scaffold3474:12917:35280:+ [translate_table: standard]